MLILGAAMAILGTVCSQSCWQAPPITSRSPDSRVSVMGRPADARAELEPSRSAERNQRHHRVDLVGPYAITMPRNRIPAISVIVHETVK